MYFSTKLQKNHQIQRSTETITSDDYHDFEEYIQNEHELFKEYADFYSQFGLKGVSVPKPMAIVSITFTI